MAFHSFAGSEWNSRVFGRMGDTAINFIANQYESLRGTLADSAHCYIDRARDVYENYISDESRRKTRESIQKYGNQLGLHITQCSNLEHFTTAPIPMQRWLMANPKAIELVRKQTISGYEGSWSDTEPTTKPEMRSDYKKVVDGIWMNDPMDSSALKCTHYMGEEWEGVEMPLLVDEKVDILSSWEFMNAIMGAGDKDPTSQTGGFM